MSELSALISNIADDLQWISQMSI